MKLLEKTEFLQLNETLWHTTLANGLSVYLLPKAGFHKTYANMTTNFGSLDLQRPNGLGQYPAGIAHFLEHKLFEKADYDAFSLFGKLGADSNAYTSFTKTSYLFSATSQVHECMNILLDFVQAPYFSAESVAKEQGIIASEIAMYQDDADWRLFAAVLENLYPNTPLAQDIAGTPETIAQITPELLYECYQTYYHPKNMSLFVVGNFDVEHMATVIFDNQQNKSFAKKTLPPFQPTSAFTGPAIASSELQLAVTNTKAAIGIKACTQLPHGKSGMRLYAALEVAISLLFDENSAFYQSLYDDGIIDDTFSYDLKVQRNFACAIFAGDTTQPQAFCQRIKARLMAARDVLQTLAGEFALEQKEFIGLSVMALNSLEGIADSFSGKFFDNQTILSLPKLYESLTFADLLDASKKFFAGDEAQITQVVITPKRGQEQ